MTLDAPAAAWFIAAGAALALAFVVLRAQGGGGANRRLAMLLALEGLSTLTLAVEEVAVPQSLRATQTLANSPPVVVASGYLRDACIVVLSAAYLLFLARLDTPLVKPFRARWAPALVWTAFGALGVFTLYTVWVEQHGGPSADATIYPLYALVGLFALAASVHAAVRAPRGSLARRRALGFVGAFGVRDASTVVGVVVYAVAQGNRAARDAAVANSTLWPVYAFDTALGTLAFVALLAYAILRTQLFDIDLKIKLGIERSTIATLFAIAVLVTQKVVEHYATAGYGWFAAIVIAVVMLVFRKRIENFAERVANGALPKVQPTHDYIAFKKLEVYKAAVESAKEAGGIDEKDKRILANLQAKLGLARGDCAAVEAEVLGASA
ncbi:MAG: hypothetical protein ACYDCK_07300 [Thermoplasmatota archaeon]